MALRFSDKVSVSAVYLLAMFMAIMDITMTNVALQTLGREFGVHRRRSTWWSSSAPPNLFSTGDCCGTACSAPRLR